MLPSSEKIGFIAFRLTSAYLLIRAMDVLSSFGLFFANTHDQLPSLDALKPMVAMYIIWFILYIAAAIVLCLQSENVSNFFLGSIQNDETEPLKIQRGYFETVAYSIMGVYVLATTFPHLARILYSFAFSHGPSPATLLEIVGTIVSLFVGAILVFRAKALQSFIQRARGM
ncbi:MAG: hypothetical protein NTV54_10030 [Ignavibacteriales bacterium]|nr:hypothetical protein [Ignavibacteriales bacterium]